MKNIYAYILIISIACIALLSSCSNNEDGKPGYEFMPDMYRSPSLEIYSSNSFFKDSLNARLPVAGTIPRGFVPFDYDNNLEDYLLAGNQLKNPFKYSDENIEKGKKLYEMFCAHCHGEKGNGDGKTITIGGYPAAPPAYNTLKDRKPGSIFHTITHGKNAMGPHASQLNKDERWKVAMYVRTMQFDGEINLEELISENLEVNK